MDDFIRHKTLPFQGQILFSATSLALENNYPPVIARKEGSSWLAHFCQFRNCRRQGLSDRLWQGRFYSTVMDAIHFQAALRYLKRNPAGAGVVEVADAYEWSRAAAHCGFPL